MSERAFHSRMAMKEIKAASLAIHTDAELKKTNEICAAHLTGKTP